jgi:predicted Zn-dependent protease
VAAQSQSSLVRLPDRSEDAEAAYVVEAPAAPAGEIPAFQTHFFESIRAIRAQAVAKQQRALRQRSLAEARGYAREDLYAIAEIAYHYLFNGGLRLALVLYEGLTAVAPDEAYFALALGLTQDHLRNQEAALHWYQRAGALDPEEPRADLNQAELFLQNGQVEKAQLLLERGLDKSEARQDAALSRKARALLKHIAKR